MSKTKAATSTTKFPTINSVCSFDTDENLTFHLKPTRLEQITSDDECDSRYILTRAQVRKLLKASTLAPTESTVAEDESNSVYVDVPYDYQSYTDPKRRRKAVCHYDILRVKGGKIKVGCQTFSARAVKTLREWSGSVSEGKK